MADNIYNSATATYNLDGSSTEVTATSNSLGIELNSSNGVTLTKTATPTTFSVGSIISYSVTITNSSSNYFTGVRITDNLGSGYLAYVVGSASLTSSSTYAVTPIATNPLTFALQELGVNETMTLTYRAQVIFNLPSSVSSITNTVTGIGYTASGTATGYASSTIQKKTETTVGITKSSSVTTVVPNQTFSYYLTLANSGSTSANVSTISDQLPSNFVLTEVKLQVGSGSSQTLSSSDYTISSGNLFSVPSGTGPTITVPASGSTIVTLTGYFSE